MGCDYINYAARWLVGVRMNRLAVMACFLLLVAACDAAGAATPPSSPVAPSTASPRLDAREAIALAWTFALTQPLGDSSGSLASACFRSDANGQVLLGETVTVYDDLSYQWKVLTQNLCMFLVHDFTGEVVWPGGLR